MYKLTLTIENPMARESTSMTYQFDQNTLDQAKWNSAFPAVQTALGDLIAKAATSEPAKW